MVDDAMNEWPSSIFHTRENPAAAREGRSRAAADRALLAVANLSACDLCAHHCGANRLKGESSPCHATAQALVFSAQLEVGDELELIPTFAIALSGCNLRCQFCISGALSWNARAGRRIGPEELAHQAKEGLQRGARTIMFLGGEPSVHLPYVLQMVAHLPNNAHLVWKTNSFASGRARAWLDGICQTWVADYKFGNEECARRLAGLESYQQPVRGNLLWAAEHVDLIIRHLILPGHVGCCWAPIANWLESHLPGVKVSLRTGYWPAWQAAQRMEINRRLERAESAEAFEIARRHHLRLIP